MAVEVLQDVVTKMLLACAGGGCVAWLALRFGPSALRFVDAAFRAFAALPFVGKILLPVLFFAAFLFGGSKHDTNAVLRLAFRPPQLTTVSPHDIARGWQVWEVRTNETGFAMPANAVRNEDWFRFGGHSMFDFVSFGEGWTFPYGTQELARVTAMEDGGLRVKLSRTEDEIRAVPCPLAALPHQSQFGHTTNGQNRVFAWQGFFSGGDTGAVISASVELRANGDFVTRSNAVETLCRRIEPFDYDGDGIPNDRDERPCFYDGNHYGQSEAWVRVNFTNAEEILSVGYRQWVDAQVGVGLANGLYKLTATFPEPPRRTTLLTVGDLSVCVTNAGEYVFILEKGVEYEFGTVPYDGSVEYAMQDDVSLFATLLMSTWGGWSENGEWTIDGGWSWLNYPSPISSGICGWMPMLRGSPDLSPQGPSSDTMTFSALLLDYCHAESVSYHWSSDDEKVEISSPNSRVTDVLFAHSAFGEELNLQVEARVGGNSLCSSLSCRLRLHPKITISVAPGHIWVNQPVSDANKRDITVRFSADIPTNGTLTVSYIGDASHLGLAGVTRTWSVNALMNMSRENPLEFNFGVAEGLMPSDSMEGEMFECRFEGPGVSLAVTNAIVVAKVENVELWSEKGGDSTKTIFPFRGQAENPFDRTHSPYHDNHYPILFSNVVDASLHVLPFDVEYRVRTLPDGFSVRGGMTTLSRIATPNSGTTINSLGKTAIFRNPAVGGEYRISVAYADSPSTGTTLVLPPSGADVESIILADFVRADAFCAYITNHYGYFEINNRRNGRAWFYDNGMGDYRGRADSLQMPVVWSYNQVNDENGMGGCVTWRGIPIREGKLSNMMVAYACEKIGVLAIGQWWMRNLGTDNGPSAALSWGVGRRIANEGDIVSNITDLVQRSWFMDDEKPRRLWPNNNSVETYVRAAPDDSDDLNYDYQFYSPNFMEPRFYKENEDDENH